MLSTPFRAQIIALSPSTGGPELSLLCPVRALRVYIEHSASYRKSEQLFVGLSNRAKGSPVTKQRISRWLVDVIKLAYSSLGLQCPIGFRAHSTRGIASYIYIYIYTFSRRFYPKRLTLHSSYSFYILSALAFPGNRTHDLSVASAMLYQLSYRKAIDLFLGMVQQGVHFGNL